MDVVEAVIGGTKVATGNHFEVTNPSTGEPLARVARCGSGEIDGAVAAARATFDSVWRQTSPAHRGRILRSIGDSIRAEAAELADLESRDTGKPLSQAKKDVEVAARYFEFYGGAVETVYGDTIPLEPDMFVFTLREPLGVTAHIIPWNYPLQVGARSVAPSLAAGNCCVLKPAEEAPMTALRLGEIALDAGLPPGALNVVPGLGEEAGAPLAAHPGINHLSFTGSPEVGRLVARSAAQNIVPVILELGGKSPNIVFADAVLDEALPVIVNSILQNAGQTCSAGSRLLVESRVLDDVVAQVAERFASVRIGPGIDDPDLGPLISAKQRDRVSGYVERGKQEARLVAGGQIPADAALGRGFYFAPTLFTEVPPDAAIANEEIFGPVLSVMPFDGAEAAAAAANATQFGLVAAVWTRDIDKAHWLAREIRAGQVFVNTYGAGGGVELPFGGYKASGFGREKGLEALAAYSQTKTVAMKVAKPKS